MSDQYTRKMLSEIRNISDRLNEVELPKGAESPKGSDGDTLESMVITSKDVQFGSVRASQEEAIRKTVGDVSLKSDALKYYPDIHDLVLNGEVSGIGVTFQFRYKDPSGDGCYIWASGLQMTDANLRTVDKIRDAFLNWKQSLIEDGDLLDKLDKQVNKE